VFPLPSGERNLPPRLPDRPPFWVLSTLFVPSFLREHPFFHPESLFSHNGPFWTPHQRNDSFYFASFGTFLLISRLEFFMLAVFLSSVLLFRPNNISALGGAVLGIRVAGSAVLDFSCSVRHAI